MEGKILSNILGSAKEFSDEAAIDFHDDRWMLTLKDDSGSAMFASVVPEEAMDEYNRDGVETVGVNLTELDDFVPGKQTPVELAHTDFRGVNKFVVKEGDTEIRLPAVSLHDIGSRVEEHPSTQSAIQIWAKPDFLEDFISDADKIGAEFFVMSAREGLLYLYAKADDKEVIEKIHWEDFLEYDIDWSKGMKIDEVPDAVPNPTEDRIMEVFLNLDFGKMLNFWEDRIRIDMNHHLPFKTVFQSDSEIKCSYIIAPRIPETGSDTLTTIPEEALSDRQTLEL